jgi:hypothetical protein
MLPYNFCYLGKCVSYSYLAATLCQHWIHASHHSSLLCPFLGYSLTDLMPLAETQPVV